MCIRDSSSCVGWKKLSHKARQSYPPKSTISEDHISAPRGCCAPNFLHVLENDQVLLAHPHREHESPLQFFSKGVQIGLKFDISMPVAFGVNGVPLWNFATWRAIGWAWSLMYKFLGACTPEIWEGQKIKQLAWFQTIFDFDREYLKNRSRYQNLETNLIENNFYGI